MTAPVATRERAPKATERDPAKPPARSSTYDARTPPRLPPPIAERALATEQSKQSAAPQPAPAASRETASAAPPSTERAPSPRQGKADQPEKKPAKDQPEIGDQKEAEGAAPAAGDIRLRNVITRVEKTAEAQKKHAPAAKKIIDARKAADPPDNERRSVAQASKVRNIDGASTAKPDEKAFLDILREKLEDIAPKNLEEVDEFKSSGKAGEMKGALTGEVNQQKNAASADVRARTEAEPNTAAVPEQVPVPLQTEPGPPAAPRIDAVEAVPEPLPEEAVSLEASKEKTEQQLKDNDLTEAQLRKANDPQFSAVIDAKRDVAEHADRAPGEYRKDEALQLGASRTAMVGATEAAVGGMRQSRGVSLAGVTARQGGAKQVEEEKRREVAQRVEAIYAETTKAVQDKLASIDVEVNKRFDEGEGAARKEMEDYVHEKKEIYKAVRYGGWGGSALWLKDKLLGLPDEVQVFYDQARELYLKRMDAVIVDIANLVETRLKEAKAEVARGKQRIQEYVDGLPNDLAAAGKAAQRSVESRFEELERAVDDKKNELANSLATKYKEARDKADERLKEMRAEDKGLADRFLDAVVGVIKILLDFKNRIVSLVGEAVEVIGLIVSDPIAFLGNLLGAIKKGIGQFVDNIWTHLKEGFMAWLFGALADAGITMPTEFSLKSIFGLVLQLLGITTTNLRKKAVALIGERNMELIEQVWEFVSAAVTGGISGLWEHIKEYLGDLKDTIVAAVQDWVVTQVIKAAVTKLISMFNPVGAIIQAIMMIYDTVTFFIERINQIMSLVKAIVSSVANIARGKVQDAANWIEKSLARAIPVMIGFLASLLGLGGISKKIRDVITTLQQKVDKAIDKMIAKVVGTVGKLFGKRKAAKDGRKADDDGPRRSPEEEAKWQRGVAGVNKDIEDMRKDGLTLVEIKEHIPSWKSTYGFTSLTMDIDGNHFELDGEMSPKKKIAAGTAAAKDIPPTVIEYGGMHRVGGKKMEANPLTRVGKAGTAPSIESGLWSAVNRLRKGKRLYIRGHLLNMHLGGPGDDERNLTPFSYSANANHEVAVERKLKDLVLNKGRYFKYTVKVNYPSSPVMLDAAAKRLGFKRDDYCAEEGELATSITVTWQELERSASDPRRLVKKKKDAEADSTTIDNVPPFPGGLTI